MLIERDSIHWGTCCACGMRILWATAVASGKTKPFDPPIALHVSGSDAYVHVDLEITMPHTCPQAPSLRRPS